VVDSKVAALPSSLILVQNRWSGYSGSVYTEVYAGGDPNDSTLGMVAVMQFDDCTHTDGAKYYPDPHQDGALRISDERGDAVLLQATDGASSSFDLTTRTFSS